MGDEKREGFARQDFRQLLEGLHYLHSKGVCHRDLKLENLLLDKSMVLKIADFGVARVMQKTSSNQTMSTFCGTEDYMAPEVLKGSSYDGFSADIWSCGVILYSILEGCFPFENIEQICHGDFDFTMPGLSEEAKSVVRSMLVIDPAARPSLDSLLGMPWCSPVETGPSIISLLH